MEVEFEGKTYVVDDIREVPCRYGDISFWYNSVNCDWEVYQLVFQGRATASMNPSIVPIFHRSV